MADVQTTTQSTVSTVKRIVCFQLVPSPAAIASANLVTKGDLPIPYKVTSDSDPKGYKALFTDRVTLDALVPGEKAELEIFDTKYELVVHGDVQSDPKKLSWYRQRLYMLGYLDADEIDAADLDIPAASAADAEIAAFQGKLSVAFLSALLAFQADAGLPQDQDIARDSDAVKKTRARLDLEAGA